jgi:hypothetical protein
MLNDELRTLAPSKLKARLLAVLCLIASLAISASAGGTVFTPIEPCQRRHVE